MPNSVQDQEKQDQEKQDQRKRTDMEESTAITIEFLRARLQSERSVSRTARQRVDELAKRVVELEEQLQIGSLQRKKAEKATTEVLAILENHGISDFSEEYDSSSEQEGVLCESKESNHSTNEEEISVASRPRNNNVDFSGSEFEISPLPGRNLSSKRCKDGPNSLEKNKYIDQSRRRQSSFGSACASSPEHLGKSSRQIKQRETRSVVVEARDESIMLVALENGVATHLEDVPNCFNGRPETLREASTSEEDKQLLEGLVSGLEKQRTNASSFVDGSRRDTDMERALEQQAQLIGRYEAEENAQREWEEKFRGNNSCTPDSCEVGNRSDITEERNEIREEASEPADTIASHDRGAKPEAEDVFHTEEAPAKTLPNGLLPTAHVGVGCFHDQQWSNTLANESQDGFPEFAFPGLEKLEATNKRKQKQECFEKNSLHPPSRDSSRHLSMQKSSLSHAGGSLYHGESSGHQNEPHALNTLTLHKTANGLGAVLEALQRAKLSLKHEFNRLPLSREGGPVGRAIEPPFEVNRLPLSREGGPLGRAIEPPLEVNRLPLSRDGRPVGRAIEPPFKVNRLPLSRDGGSLGRAMEPPFEVNRLPLSRKGEHVGRVIEPPVPVIKAGDAVEIPIGFAGVFREPTDLQFEATPPTNFMGSSLTRYYPDMGVGVAGGDRYTASPYLKTGSTVYTREPYFDPYLNSGTGLPASSRHTYPSYADLMPRMPSKDGFPRPSGMPAGSHFSSYDHQIRPNMHR